MSPTTVPGSIIQEIIIQAPPERIFQALTDPRQVVKWWGDQVRFQTTRMECDLRPGGKWSMGGTGMGGRPFTVRGEYRAIDRPRVAAAVDESPGLGPASR